MRVQQADVVAVDRGAQAMNATTLSLIALPSETGVRRACADGVGTAREPCCGSTVVVSSPAVVS
jgi:hypothetical protein